MLCPAGSQVSSHSGPNSNLRSDGDRAPASPGRHECLGTTSADLASGSCAYLSWGGFLVGVGGGFIEDSQSVKTVETGLVGRVGGFVVERFPEGSARLAVAKPGDNAVAWWPC